MSEETQVDTNMKIDPSRASALVSQLQGVQSRVASAARDRSVRLVAVSKLKPANDILALHQDPTNHLHFGENYAQELSQKSEMLPRSIKWHFIGGLQSGRCKALASIPNLYCISSVESIKKADLLEKSRAELRSSSASPQPEKLNVHVQVNTSGEESKSGCEPGAETVSLCRHITEACPNLHLLGLMTIGAIARSHASSADAAASGQAKENEDFVTLREQRDLVAQELGLSDKEALELSMGMSEDFESAIASGSAEVRVGSTIFGERPAKADAKIVDQ